jgi:hypothetical protein
MRTVGSEAVLRASASDASGAGSDYICDLLGSSTEERISLDPINTADRGAP